MSYRIHLRLDADGIPSLSMPRPLRLVGKQEILLDVLVEQLVVSSLPPAYTPVNISGYAGTLIGKDHVNDDDVAALWNVTGAFVTDGTDGLMRFTIPASSDDIEVDLGYGEVILSVAGAPRYRMPVPFTLTRAGLGA